MDFQDIFPHEKIINIKELTPGYDDHASDVWLVRTNERDVIVRASGIEDVKTTGAFFTSLNTLFGLDPTNVFSLEAINNTLSGLKSFAYPRVIEKHKLDREYAVVELLPGTTLRSFDGLSDAELKLFGKNLAKIHNHKMEYWGNPSGTFRISLDEVNNHIISSMKKIVNQLYLDNFKIVDKLPEMERILNSIPTPEYTSFVLVDIDPTQFLVDNGIITGLVDTEAYVIAPREFDFIALEYVLDIKAAGLVSKGYKTILPLPDLSTVRKAYRYLYRLIEVQGDDDIDDWLSQPVLF